ncbi:GNAT family N-acetyltransferase [Faecalimicrobium sp. JNUCC 81]
MIETSRCILRCFKEKDLELFIAYRNNEEWMKHQNLKYLSKDDYRKDLLGHKNINEGIRFAISDRITDTLLGDIYIIKKEKTISIGYAISPIYSRKGYIIESLKAVLPLVRKNYPECEIIAMTKKENIPSKNLLLNLGFIYDEWIEKLQSEVYIYPNE